MRPGGPAASLGLRARTGRAIAVLVAGPPASPRILLRTELRLEAVDGPLPQPYHAVMELPWEEAVLAARPAERALEAAATGTLEAFLQARRSEGLEIASLAVVGAPDRDLRAIGGPHVRAHAAEGLLFRRVWQAAAASLGLPAEALPDRGLEPLAAERLGLSPAELQERLAAFGRAVGRPWRAEEKAAALAGWLACLPYHLPGSST